MDKQPFTENILIKFERISHLNMLTTFEREFIQDFQRRFTKFGMKTSITDKQIIILDQIYQKYLTSLGKDRTDYLEGL